MGDATETPIMPVILTACTQRKRVAPNPFLCARDLPIGTLGHVAQSWMAKVATVEAMAPAKDIYCGRSFVEAKKAADAAQAELHIVSAGLGLIRSQQEIPSYNLTVSKGSPDCVLDKLQDHGDADWWAALGGHKMLNDLLGRSSGLIMIALPSSYLRMVAPALQGISDALCERIRIVGGRDVPNLNPRLESVRLPYDDRLDGPQSTLPGTWSDFASRAVRHFVENILAAAPLARAKEHAELVEIALSGWDRPLSKSGTRMSDSDLKLIVRDHWSRADGRATRLLRILRDELNIACEQKRFSRLTSEIREEGAL
ncbi:DUF6884 domain-containing protein [Rhizobium sp. Root483D2]|uniref:DUF6884 domain-containing protein n=1 Tax=Rhizobium sp. Root483D2 TaxID=1736545 RepID=UPI000714AC29|nr:DUF6884 domain-containing protein [Rhizobium sp. Root483D2]KQY25922.1 hypothetical protein ASD32_25920 [Rhizobium sp. Root483D2]